MGVSRMAGIARLQAELNAIEWWHEVSAQHVLQLIEEDAFTTRRERREEIKAEVQALRSQSN